MRSLGLDPVQHVEQDRLLLLERAGDVEAGVELVDHPLERGLRPLGLELLGDLLQLGRVQVFVAVGIKEILSGSTEQPLASDKIAQSDWN